jgi:glycosyltransferase involved in cell wall biosynthesis
VVIVHDYLSQRGGAERVVLSLSRLFPSAPIYTSFYAPELTYPEFKQLDVRPSGLQDRIDPDHFRRAVFQLPSAFSAMDLTSYDRALVSSSGFAHHIHHPNAAVYCYTPPRFLYDTTTYLGNRAKAAAVWLPFEVLRHRDRRAALAKRSYSAISIQSARRMQQAYNFTGDIIHPPLATAHLPSIPPPFPATPRALVIARLLPYKRVDVAIKACAEIGLGLTIVGEGPEEERLRSLGRGADVTFLGRIDDDELRGLFAEHSLVLIPGVEDFGYAPIEANYAGRPAVAIAAGGSLETIEDGVNGQLVAGWGLEAWTEAIAAVVARQWGPGQLRAATERFHEASFHRSISEWVDLTLD